MTAILTGVLSARGLAARAGGRTLFQGLDVEIEPARIVLVTGPNGAGKSTLLRILLGLRKPGAGSVVRAPRTTVGYVPQLDPGDEGLPFPALSVVLQGLPRLFPGRAARALAQAALGRAGFRPPVTRRYSLLSGGERRRVLLARALAASPSILALDEPFAGVDAEGAEELGALVVGEARARGAAVLCVSHGSHALESEVDAFVRLGEGA